jgi:hypothetical protein
LTTLSLVPPEVEVAVRRNLAGVEELALVGAVFVHLAQGCWSAGIAIAFAGRSHVSNSSYKRYEESLV